MHSKRSDEKCNFLHENTCDEYTVNNIVDSVEEVIKFQKASM